ncbi:MAG: hypothetical protein R6V85_11995 [Polyangia bacterium]
MSLLALLSIVTAAVGALALWLSGLLLGQRRAVSSGDEAQKELASSREELKASLAAAEQKGKELLGELRFTREERDAARKGIEQAEDEMASAATRLGRIEAELDQARGEVERLQAENERLDRQRQLAAKSGTAGRGGAASEDIDDALAELDIERVAHRRTQKKLEQERKASEKLRAEIESLRLRASAARDGERPSGMPGPPKGAKGAARGGSGFKTASISLRGQQVESSEYARLRQAHDKLLREKEQLESEHARALEQLKLLRLQSK